MSHRNSFLVCVALFVPSLAGLLFAQEVTVSGVVRDVNTLARIRGANIIVSGTQLGTSSDYAGRFHLKIPGATSQTIVEFRHIGYEPKVVPLDSLRQMENVDLQPRIIQLPGVQIEEKGVEKLEIEKDIPQTVNVIEARSFEIQGYVDAGDLLRVDHSIQVDEELSGRKTVTIRGGNADEVVVLYNGVKLNNAYDNVYDLSLIDLNDVDRFEIIKGSNTALYGPEAFSGVINIVPKIQQDYNIRFQQRLGTYRSGNWGLQLYKRFDRLHTAYSFQRGATERVFSGIDADSASLRNDILTHTANVSYSLSENADRTPDNEIGLMWLYSSFEYENDRDNELVDNFNHLFSGRYSGLVDFAVSFRHLEEDQFLSFANGQLTGSLQRGIQDESIFANLEKRFEFDRTEVLFGYQFQHAELVDERREDNNFGQPQTSPLRADLKRLHHGLVGIAKYRGEAGAVFLRNVNIDVSIRHDRVEDQQTAVVYPSTLVDTPDNQFDNSWNETLVKFSLGLVGYRNDLSFEGFFNYGRNVKFPTLFQQVSTSSVSGGLEPEKNNSFELGMVVSKEIEEHRTLYGWQMSANYFLNNYDNKFLEARNLFGGRSQFSNTQVARISGFEGKASLFMFRKKVTFEVGLSRYFISEKAAFPFKSDFKGTFSFAIDHAGYSFQVFAFKEGEQLGLILDQNQENVEVVLPDYTNLDVHVSKTFELWKFKVFGNLSARNLLEDGEVELQGLTIRDRRFYVTFGVQY